MLCFGNAIICLLAVVPASMMVLSMNTPTQIHIAFAGELFNEWCALTTSSIKLFLFLFFWRCGFTGEFKLNGCQLADRYPFCYINGEIRISIQEIHYFIFRKFLCLLSYIPAFSSIRHIATEHHIFLCRRWQWWWLQLWVFLQISSSNFWTSQGLFFCYIWRFRYLNCSLYKYTCICIACDTTLLSLDTMD